MDYRNLHSLDPRQMLHLFIIISKLKLGFNFSVARHMHGMPRCTVDTYME